MSRATIRVTFVDTSNGSVLGIVDIPPSRLPRSFEAATVIHLGDDNWEVLRAIPADAEGFEASGELRLEMRHVVAPPPAPARHDDPSRLLFSVPTIADATPTATSPRPTGAVFDLPEDDWRQIEFVHIDALDAVRAEIAAIQRVHDEQRLDAGYRACHVRREATAPLRGTTVWLDALRGAFQHVTTTFDAFALRGHEHAVDSGFAFRTASGLTVYGVAPEGRVTVCGMIPDRTRKAPPLDAAALATIRNTHGLLFVDWCARIVVAPTRN